MKRLRKFWWVLALVPVLALGGFVVWAETPLGPMPEAMAARFTYQNPGTVEGLVLWAAYPAESDDLSGRDLAMISIYGTRDGLATGEKIDASRPLLPPDTRWVAIEGGNHAQFGWYGPQARDNAATISRAAQQEQVIAATVDLLDQIELNGE